MNYKLVCATNELELLKMEMDGIDDVMKDPASNELEKYSWGLRLRVLEMGRLMLEEIIIRQIDESPLGDFMPANIIGE